MGRLVTVVAVVAFAVGAGGALVFDRLVWDQDLQKQLVEKDHLLAALQSDVDHLQAGLEDLKKTNTAMRGLIDDAWNDAAEVARSHASSLEKLRAVIVRLETLQKDLEGAQP